MEIRFASVSSYPGRTGSYFYNKMFEYLGLNFSYQALKVTEVAELQAIFTLGHYRGVSISMPYKTLVLNYLDKVTEVAKEFNSCNSILIDDGNLQGHNTDIFGIYKSLELLDSTDSVALLGGGSIATQYSKILSAREISFSQFSRKQGNWDERHSIASDVVVNATSIGTLDRSSPIILTPSCRYVIDLSLRHGNLQMDCDNFGVSYFSGMDFYEEVFREQFLFYTGLNADMEFFHSLKTAFDG